MASTKFLKRERLKATLSDYVSKLFYYDRKEDEDLPVGEIEKMVKRGDLTADEICSWLTEPIRTHLEKKR